MWAAPESIPAAWRRAGADKFERELSAHAQSKKDCFVWFEGSTTKRMSFAEAHSAAEALAQQLRGAALATGSLSHAGEDKANVVGLVLKRSPALCLGQLSAWKAGSTFVPCDPSWPVSRTVEILAEAEAKTVVSNGTQEEFEQLCSAVKAERQGQALVLIQIDHEARVLQLVKEGPVAEFQPASRVETSVQPEVMYIMYTSGSTGKPKGCLVPSAGVINRIDWGAEFCRHSSEDVFLHKTPLTFDVSIPEMWSPLRLGATSVIVPEGSHMDFVAVKETMERGCVTVAEFVPSILSMFLDFVSPGDIPSLRQVICAGEALLVSHKTKLHQKFGRTVNLLNLYGPTEAAIEVLGLDCTEEVPGVTHGFPLNQGSPPRGCEAYIVDLNDPSKAVPDGETGELCLGGIQIAYGYVNRPDLTKERFLPNPFGPGLVYRTGDLATRSEGFITYSGRADRQVKLNGVRIELGEIETVLLKAHSALKNAAVEVIGGSMVAVVAAVAGAEAPSEASMRKQLGEVLPSSHVPTEWHICEEIPVSSAGKVDHKSVVEWIQDQQKARVWGSIYDEMYFADDFQVDDGGDDPTMDWAAYYDSFTGAMHERNTIEEWVAETVKEVALYKPRKVMEMGCGKGMILFKMAAIPSVKSLVCCDLSAMAIKHVDKLWAWMHEKGHVTGAKKESREGPSPTPINSDCEIRTFVRDASNYAGIGDGSLDAVVCNGVAMHFPSAKYLVEVFQKGLPKVSSTGKFHLGDIISLAHQPMFLLRRARHMDPDGTFKKLQEEAFRQEVLAGAKDRAYDHKMFYSLMQHQQLAGVAAVEVQLKHGQIMSEFSRYRYNVILHRGEPQQAAPLTSMTVTGDLTVSGIVAKVKESAASSPSAVLALHSIPNARLTADVLLRDAVKDAVAPAVQLGAGDGGGICPAELRSELAKLDGHHVVLTWSRDGCADHMDLYVLPLKAGIFAGLAAVQDDALSVVSAEQLESWREDIAGFSNVLSTVDDEKPKEVSADVMQEVRALWDEGKREDALLRLMGDKLSQGKADPEADFKTSGGNSFVAMAIVGAIRQEFGVSAAVFELLTLPLGKFAKAVLDKCDKKEVTGSWLIEQNGEKFVAGSGATVVLFPQAGSGPSQYAGVGKHFLTGCPSGRCLYVQPPGREGRAAEPNIKDNGRYIKEVAAALRPYLLGEKRAEGPVTFLGDSWGSIACFCTLHELRRSDGFVPVHAVFSGDACPAIADYQNGMGSYSDASVAELPEADMLEFMKATGAAITSDASTLPDKVILDALQSDMLLYEQYKRPADLQLLPCAVSTIRGEKDGVVTAAEMLGWLDEFQTAEKQSVTVPGATHHVHAEKPEAVAKLLLSKLS